jgi:hypothetical protein
VARFSPGYNIAGLQPSESAYDLSHLDKVPDEVPDKGQQWLTPLLNAYPHRPYLVLVRR